MDIENNKEKIERTLTRFAMMVETSRECSPSFSDFVAAIHLGRKERGGMMFACATLVAKLYTVRDSGVIFAAFSLVEIEY